MPERTVLKELSGYGDDIYALIERLYPICRSISGQGLRDTLQIVSELIPLEVHEVATGTKVFDWEVPREWAIRGAYIEDANGQRVVDFFDSNLHVVNYSCAVDATLPLSKLREHLHTDPDHPDWIPYRTSYYNEDWGFCLTQNQLDKLADGDYRAVIDADLFYGALSYGEYCVPGRSADEILLFAHCCHPSLCNDNLSGVAMLAVMAKQLSKEQLYHTVRFVFAPATIGSITWLARNQDNLANIRAGLVASVLGDSGHFRYKLSGHGNALVDRAARHVLEHTAPEFDVLDFSPWGYDERQFCSPGINLPVGRLTRSPNGEYPEYHTSADNLDLVAPQYLDESFHIYWDVIACIDSDRVYRNKAPYCEPQLGRRGLYRKMGGYQDIEETKLAMLWMLNRSDGKRSLLTIAEQSRVPWRTLAEAAELLVEHGLLEFVPRDDTGVER